MARQKRARCCGSFCRGKIAIFVSLKNPLVFAHFRVEFLAAGPFASTEYTLWNSWFSRIAWDSSPKGVFPLQNAYFIIDLLTNSCWSETPRGSCWNAVFPTSKWVLNTTRILFAHFLYFLSIFRASAGFARLCFLSCMCSQTPRGSSQLLRSWVFCFDRMHIIVCLFAWLF